MTGPATTPRLVLHVGDPKTGSSSIQKILFEKGWQSDARSLDYPDSMNAYPLVNALKPNAPEGQADSRFKPYSEWLARSTADVAVISAETFSLIEPEVVAAAAQRYFPGHAAGMQVVAYARPHISRFLSAYVQRTKVGEIYISLEAFLDSVRPEKLLNFHSRFLKWRAVFGDRFLLRPMERQALREGDVVADFLNIALGGAPFRLLAPTQVNSSMSVEALAGLRLMQSVLQKFTLGGNSQHAIGARINDLVGEAGNTGTKLRLSQKMYDRLHSLCAADAERLDQDFFDTPVMTEALRKAGSDALPDAQDWDAAAFFDDAALTDLRRTARRLGRLFQAQPGVWEAPLRRERGFASPLGRPGSESASTIKVIARTDALLADAVALLTGKAQGHGS